MEDSDYQELLARLAASRAATQAKLDALRDGGANDDVPVFKIPLIGVRNAKVTINNGEQDISFAIRHFRRDKDKKLPPEYLRVDVKRPGTDLPVGRILCKYPDPELDEDGNPVPVEMELDAQGNSTGHPVSLPMAEYQFVLSPHPLRVKDPQIIYAAHLTYLMLSGVKIHREPWVDCLLIDREPTDRYELQPVEACMYCGRTLYKPSSIDSGFGPICGRRLESQFKGYDTTVVQWVRPEVEANG